MKFDQLIGYSFFKNHTESEDLFLFSQKTLHEVKASGLQLSFNIF